MTAASVSMASAATAFLLALKRQGITHLFGNAGTDFAPVIEAYAAHRNLDDLPEPVTVPHENLAMAMAHGAYLATGRPQAVMVHVNVGTANAICGLVNAARENVPILLCAGRTPVAEMGTPAGRNAYIHWGQEMFDQAAMLRELVKWDYELRRADQAAAAVGRALAIAMSEPRGPVYLTLPREILAEETATDAATVAPASAPFPDATAIEQAATWLAAADRPVIVTASFGRSAEEGDALGALSETHALPVVAYRPRYLAIPTGHPAFVGYDPQRHIADADLILVLACDVPWIPAHGGPPPDTRIVHIGVDPLFTRYPMRGFRSDLNIAGAPAQILRRLDATTSRDSARMARRSERLAAKRRAFEDRRAGIMVPRGASTAAWLAHCISGARKPGDVIVNEAASLPLTPLNLDEPGSYFGAPSAGGLGWGLGAALGIKLGRPDRRVIAVVGDGAYMFGNPTPAHFVAAAMRLPTLTVILNNRMWAGVRRSTLAVYPDGAAAAANDSAFTYLEPSPDYEKVVAASGGYGECVAEAAALPAALTRALAAVGEGRQAVLNVLVEYSDEEARRDAKS